MIYYIAAFLCPMFNSLSCIIDSHLSNKVFKKPATLIFYSNITTFFFALPLIFIFGKPSVPDSSALVAIAIVAFINVFYLFPWYIVLKKIDTSISVAMFAIGKIMLPVFAWIIVGEKLHFVQYLGFGIILLPSIFLNLDIKKMKINIAFWLMLFISVILSLSSVLNKYSVVNTDFVSVLFWVLLISASMSLTLLLVPPARRDIVCGFGKYKKKIRLFLANDVLMCLVGLANLLAMSSLPVLLVKSISSTQSIFTLITGFILWKFFNNKSNEDFSRGKVIKKLVSFVFIIIGIYLVMR